ncbi:hypothetical protein N7461_002840 [Penicillium sp. DV-2018c]|nr:hypothetical protein N7461_002840 [Penicillium sp. DV-2018c]
MNQPKRMKMLEPTLDARENTTIVRHLPRASQYSLHEAAWVDLFHQRVRVSLKAKTRDCAVRNLATEICSNVGTWVPP